MKKRFRFRKKPLFEPVSLDQVKVSGEIGQRIHLTIEKNLLALDWNKDFLAPFLERSATDYIGLGKSLEGLIHLAFAGHDQRLLKLKGDLIALLLSSADEDGYIGVHPKDRRLLASWDCHEAVHVVSALLADWFCFGEEKSLQAARKLLDLQMQTWQEIVEVQNNRKRPYSIHLTSLGIEYSLLKMYQATGDTKYLDFACNTCGLDKLDWPIQLNRFAPLLGHTYLYLHHCRCQLELYQVRPNPALLRMSQRALKFMLGGNGMSITGGVGQAECWTDDQDVRGNHAETCSTVYQLRLYAEIFRLTGDPRCGDLIERTIYNALWAAQSPDGRQIRYYSPLEGERSYFRDTYCCPNNFRRFIAELPGMIFFTGKNSVTVNLYTACEADMELEGNRVRLIQKTCFPESGHIVIEIHPATSFEFTLQFRIPLWCSKPVVRLNGNAQQGVLPGSLYALKRVWVAGDRVEVELPLEIRFVQGRQRQYGLVAVLLGPLVYCLAPQNIQPAQKNDHCQGQAAISPLSETKRFSGWDGAAFSKIRILPSSAKLLPDQSIGILADLDPSSINVQGNYELRLTRFPDPDGKCVYFHSGEPDAAIPDELLSGDLRQSMSAEIFHGPIT